MELNVLNSNFNIIGTIDTFDSLIWTIRYNSYGDFEIYTYPTADNISKLVINNYLYLKNSDSVMVIEDIQINTDSENGSRMVVTGRSLESILDRRLLWGQVTIAGSLQDSIELMLTNNVIAPSDTNRTIPNFFFESSTDEYILSLILNSQYFCENLYSVLESICQTYEIGFYIRLDDDNNLVFGLFNGVDRSYQQETNPYVVFSPKFTNLANSKYIDTIKSLKTVTLVAGEGEGSARVLTEVLGQNGSEIGLERREMYTDGSSISATTNEGTLTPYEYLDLLTKKGEEDLISAREETSFDCEISDKSIYVINQHYFLGDIVQLKNEFGIESSVRVTEVIYSQSQDGINIYPTLSSV